MNDLPEYPSIKPVERPVETPTKPTDEVSAPGGKVDTVTPEYTEKPLEIAEYIKELWKVGEAENHFEMSTLLKEINDFIISEIERNGMKSNRESYKEIIQKYEDRLKLPENIDIYTKTEKVNELIKIDMKLIQAMKDKEDLLNGDPTKMTSTQLRKYLELNATSYNRH